jgi:hypothetical protein
MSLLSQHPRLKWAAPIVAAALVVGIPLVASSQANAEPPLPARTAQELLVDLHALKAPPLSGEVTTTADLGLPQLPGFASPTISTISLGSLLTLASGTHTWRVWSDGATASRIALVQGTGESDLIKNGPDVWVWSSADASAVHSTLPAGSAADVPTPTGTPADLADEVLKALDPTTAVSVDRADYVAGRPVYELVLTPKSSATRVGSVRLAVDAETKVPLRVQVLAHDGTDAIDVAFTSVEFAKPDASTFTFTPPPGANVTEQGTGTSFCPARMSCQEETGAPSNSTIPPPPGPTIAGTGWTTVVVTPAAGAAAASGQVGALLDSLPKVSGTWGSGRLLDGTLVSVVLTDDGRVAAGAVAPDALYAALGK